jgi:hypothetical protein
MHVVLDTAGSQKHRSVFFSNAAHDSVQFVAPTLVQEFESLFRAEYKVDQYSVMS